MQSHTSRYRARPQLEALEGRWQPSASFGLLRREAFAEILAAYRTFADAYGQHGRSGGHGRHEHARSEGRWHWAEWARGRDSECGTRWRGNSCGHHHYCDRPDPAPTPQPQLGSLSGFVFVDLNSNGVPDEGEQRIEGAPIILSWNDASGGPRELTVETGADGSYLFENLAGGIEYTITEVQPFPFGDGADHPGSLGGEQGDDMFRVVLPAGARGVNYNFTETFGE